MPYATAEALDAYKKNPDVKIISNTAALQAVYDGSTCVTSAVFHEGGECESYGLAIGADTPSIVTVSNKGGELLFGATDPTQEAGVITYSLTGTYDVAVLDGKLSVSYKDGKTYIVADHTDTYSRPVRAILKEKK